MLGLINLLRLVLFDTIILGIHIEETRFDIGVLIDIITLGCGRWVEILDSLLMNRPSLCENGHLKTFIMS